MKKLGVYILLFLTIANLFAPISVQNSKIITSKTEAAVFGPADEEMAKKAQDECLGVTKKYLCTSSRYTAVGSKLQINVYAIAVDLNGDDRYKIETLKAIDTKTGKQISVPINFEIEDLAQGDFKNKVQDDIDNYDAVLFYSGDIIGLEENSSYLFSFKITHDTFAITEKTAIQEMTVTTGQGTKVTSSTNNATSSADSIMPGCQIIGNDGTIMGCLAQAFYYIVFVPTSFLFALSGQFFDWTMHYSIQDSSYRISFVTEGWKIVRDLCNIFFIFLLLTAAVKMILNIGHGEKSTIVKVVIIGLLINFSLFTTQVVIDTSNILTRLFYNSDAINIVVNKNQNPDGNGSVSSYVYGGDGILPLSAALVDKVDPQSIIIEAKRINIQSVENDKIKNPNAQQMAEGNQGIGVGPFFLVTLLAVIINLLGFFVFLSVALIFIGRVVGLWFSMIFVPLAFFSYAAPNLPDGLKRFGWSGWWNELIGTAFLAPVFMFMMYLIILFLSKGFTGLFDVDAHGAEFVLQVIVPFAVIMILLWQAKSVASEMSKGIASTATTGLKVAGGAALMLGGAGVGLAGRSLVGKTLARASAGTTATQEYNVAKRAAEGKGKDANGNKLQKDDTLMNAYKAKYSGSLGKSIRGNLGKIGNRIKLTNVLGKQDLIQGPNSAGQLVTQVSEVNSALGKAVNDSQKKVGGVNHAVHDYADMAKEAHINPETKFDDLSYEDKANMQKAYNRMKKSKVESDIKMGLAAGYTSEAEYKNANRATEIAAFTRQNGTPPKTSDLNAIETTLSNNYKKDYLEPKTTEKLSHDFEHTVKGNSEKISFKDRIAADSTRGTYNPLNMSKLDTIKNDAFATKLIFGITSAVALGMRSGMKSIPQVNMGTGSRQFKDDLKNVLSEAMKGASFKLEAPGGGGGHGGGHGHDDHGHGGGHDDHGHGGH